jgi:ribose transport system ATP-binding protein
MLDYSGMKKVTNQLLQRLELKLSPDTLVQNLKVGEQQLIEIAKALLIDAQVILMDEPTSALTNAEIDNLHRIIAELKKEGKTIVYISHKMEELFRIAEKYTVMRDGCSVAEGDMSDTTEQALIRQMVGREVTIEKKAKTQISQEVILNIQNFTLLTPNSKIVTC